MLSDKGRAVIEQLEAVIREELTVQLSMERSVEDLSSLLAYEILLSFDVVPIEHS